MTIFRFTLKRALRNPVNILLLAVLPAGIVFVPVVPGSTLPLGFHLYGQVIMFAAFLMVRSTVEDRLSGTLTRIAVAPVSYFRYLGETLLAYGLLLVLQNALFVGLGVARYGRKPRGARYCSSPRSPASPSRRSRSALAGCSLFAPRRLPTGRAPTLIIAALDARGCVRPVEMMPGLCRRPRWSRPPYWLFNALRFAEQRGDHRPGSCSPWRSWYCSRWLSWWWGASGSRMEKGRALNQPLDAAALTRPPRAAPRCLSRLLAEILLCGFWIAGRARQSASSWCFSFSS